LGGAQAFSCDPGNRRNATRYADGLSGSGASARERDASQAFSGRPGTPDAAAAGKRRYDAGTSEQYEPRTDAAPAGIGGDPSVPYASEFTFAQACGSCFADSRICASINAGSAASPNTNK
jgi:hypothetical protein